MAHEFNTQFPEGYDTENLGYVVPIEDPDHKKARLERSGAGGPESRFSRILHVVKVRVHQTANFLLATGKKTRYLLDIIEDAGKLSVSGAAWAVSFLPNGVGRFVKSAADKVGRFSSFLKGKFGWLSDKNVEEQLQNFVEAMDGEYVENEEMGKGLSCIVHFDEGDEFYKAAKAAAAQVPVQPSADRSGLGSGQAAGGRRENIMTPAELKNLINSSETNVRAVDFVSQISGLTPGLAATVVRELKLCPDASVQSLLQVSDDLHKMLKSLALGSSS